MNWSRAFIWWEQYKLGHTWSLAMEEQFYLLWHALLTLTFARRAICCVFGPNRCDGHVAMLPRAERCGS